MTLTRLRPGHDREEQTDPIEMLATALADKGVKAQSVGLDYEHTRKSFSDLRAQLMADPAYYDQQYRKLHGHGPNEQPPAQPKPSPFADWAVRNHPTSSLGSIIQVDGPWL